MENIMTEREKIEKELLLDIIMESSKWRLSEGDERDCIRIECEQRLAKYMGISPEVVGGREQSVVERGLAKQEAKAGQRHGQLRPGFHRVSVNGKKFTLHESQLEKIPYAQSPTGYRWKIREGVVPGAPEDN